MGLWIRSQDKTKIVKVNYVYIMESDNHFTIYGETIDSGPIIGIYNSKERALEILNEIQRKLINRNYYYRIDEVVGLVPEETLNTNVIYEMPEE